MPEISLHTAVQITQPVSSRRTEYGASNTTMKGEAQTKKTTFATTKRKKRLKIQTCLGVFSKLTIYCYDG